MERLTHRFEDKTAVPIKFDIAPLTTVDDYTWSRLYEMIASLAAYEDLGFSPGEIKYMLDCGAKAAGFPLSDCLQDEVER